MPSRTWRGARRIAGTRTGQVGIALCVLTVGAALIGPLLSPFSPSEVVGPPFAAPSGDHLLGTDRLGRDALSRFLHGGTVLLGVALAATVLGYLVGGALGMAAGFRRGKFDRASVIGLDLALSFPPLLLVLVVIAATGPTLTVAALSIAAVHAPRVARITRAATLEVVGQEFIEAAVARGERGTAIIVREILPNLWAPLLADMGIRFTSSVILFSSLSFLGVGQAPPAADWGLMISENRVGLLVQPWVVIAPAAAIAAMTIGVNLAGDAFSRSLGGRVTRRDA